jgi:hypothetical protein
MATDYRSAAQRMRDDLRSRGLSSDACDALVPLLVAARRNGGQ